MKKLIVFRSCSIASFAAVAIFGILPLSVRVAAAASYPIVQGFETSIGDWTPPSTTVRTPSGGGTLHLTAASGNYYAEVHNIDNDYISGYYGDSGFSTFGFATQAPYPGDFSQSIKMYVDVNWPVALYGGPGVWIDESPGNFNAGNYGGEHNFRLTPTGTAVGVFVDGQGTPIVTITTSGWYNFQMTFRKGAHPTDLVTTNMNVFDPHGNLIGTTAVVSNSPGGPLLSQDLAGPGYVWITVWPNGWAGDVLGIDDVRADLLSVCDGYGGDLKGNLTVSSGQTCLLSGSTVSGNVTQTGGSLTSNNSTITGNLQVSGGATSINASTVNGDVQIQNIPASAGPVQVCGTSVGGTLQFHNNGVPVLIGSPGPPPCTGNTVKGDVEAQNNTATEQIAGNTIMGNLQVQSNTGPTQVFNNSVTKNLKCLNNTQLLVGGPNTAAQKQGQCY